MTRMPLLALVLYISARAELEGSEPGETLIELIGRAGVLFTARDILGDNYAADVREHTMPSFEGFFRKN